MKYTLMIVILFLFITSILSECDYDDQKLIAAGGTYTIFSSPVHNTPLNMTVNSQISSQNADFIEYKVLYTDTKNDMVLVPGSMEIDKLDFCFHSVRSIIARQLLVVITCKNSYVSCNLKTKIVFLSSEPNSFFAQCANWADSHPIIFVIGIFIFFVIMILIIKFSIFISKRIYPSEIQKVDVEMTSYTKVPLSQS